MAQPRPSLRIILAAAFGGLAMLAALAASLLAGQEASRRLRSGVGEELAGRARQSAELLDRGMFARWRDLQVAAEMPLMRDPATAPELRRQILTRLHDTYGDYALLAFIGPDGRVVADSLGLLEGDDASGRPFFRRALAGQVVEDVHDAAMPAGLPGRPGEPLRLVDLAAPVRDAAGSLIGVIGAHLDWRWAAEAIARADPADPEALILSRDGAVLLGPPEMLGRILALPPGGKGPLGLDDGGRSLAVAAPTRGWRDYPGLGWVVAMRRDSDAAMAPVRALQWRILCLGIVAALAAALFGWCAAWWLARPLRQLAVAAERLRQEPGAAALPREGGFAEAATLTRALGGMLQGWRQAETALRESEARMRMAQEAAGIGTWELDLRSGRQAWSARQARLFGLDPAAPPPDSAAWMALLHPEDRPTLRAAEARARAAAPGDFAVEFRIRRADDGALRWIASRGRVEVDAAGQPARMLGINLDITEAREREARLAAREAELRAMIEANPIGVLRCDAEGRILDANDALLRTAGRGRGELGAGLLRWHDLTSPEWRQADLAGLAEAQAKGACTPYETEFLRPDGRRVPVLVGYALIGPAWTQSVSFILDLTDRKRAETALLRAKAELEERVAERTAALAAQEAELRRIHDRTPAAFHSVDAEGRLIRVSAEWLAFLGYPEEEVLGQRLSAFMPPENAARWDAAFNDPAGPPERMREFEHRMLRRDGTAVEVLMRTRSDLDAEGRFLRSYTVLLDLTERNRAEAQLREAQKLEALGRIAGGVAHDFNNMLQVMTSALRLLEAKPGDPDRVRRYTRAALEAAERGAAVTHRLLAFAGRDRLRSGPVEVAAVLQGLADLLRGPVAPGIALEVMAAPDLPEVRADRMQLELVLFNLTLNARDAMPEGGRLRLGAVLEEVGAAEAPHPQGLAPGRYLRFTVEDSGAGMDAGTLARATEPFFTTKEVGQGTGLGLAMAHGFAVQSGGALRLASAPGHGTAVTLWLPAGPAVAAPAHLEQIAGRPEA